MLRVCKWILDRFKSKQGNCLMMKYPHKLEIISRLPITWNEWETWDPASCHRVTSPEVCGLLLKSLHAGIG